VAVKRAKPGRDAIITARLAGTASRYARREPLDVDEIADGRGDLLAERAGITLGFYAREPGRVAAEGARGRAAHRRRGRPTRLTEWIAVGQERAQRVR
jgi:hypothetical protein